LHSGGLDYHLAVGDKSREASMPRSFLLLIAFISALWATDYYFLNGQFGDLVSSELRYQAKQINGAARNLVEEIRR
jgi:hypothetical protein